tara:strand:- start:61867 stop:62055 length:189 start_codon:yes stop_codon:yes gene_type:complete
MYVFLKSTNSEPILLNQDHKGDMVEFQVKSILRKSLFSLPYSSLDNMNGLLQTKTSNERDRI